MNWKLRITQVPGGPVWPARASVPVPRGTDAKTFSVRRPDGQTVPAQSRALTRWPDGSPRWVQIDFPATQTGEHIVSNMAASGGPELPVQSRQSGNRFDVTVGRLALTVDAGAASPVASIKWNGQPIAGGDWQFVANDETGQPHPLVAGSPRNLTVEANGPHRFQVSWETQHADRLLDVRFRVELLAGIEGFTLSYQFIHKLPGHDYLRFQSVEAVFPFAPLTGMTVVQSMYTNLATRRFVRPKHPVTIHLDKSQYAPHVQSAADLDDDFDYPHFLRGCELQASGAVALENADVAVVVSLRDFECHRPKTLAVAPGRVTAGIWPAEAGPLVMSQGRSHREVVCFRFAEPVAETVEAVLVNPALSRFQPAIGWLDKADSVHAGPSWDQPRLFDGTEPGAAYFSYMLQTAATRWETVAELKHYGDVPDNGYTTAYPSQGRTPDDRTDYTYAAWTMVLHAMFHAPQGMPPVWTNNEYDAIYCLALEAIRTGHDGAWQRMCAAGRHQIEVDFVHYCDHWQQHRSTPAHSYDHTSGTSTIASHQWTQGLYYYYVLTGDDDVPDVVRAICDFDLLYLTREDLGMVHYFNRELGWAVVALVFGYEVTGDARYRDAARDTLRELEKYAGRTDFRELEKHCSTSRGLNATGIGLGFVANTVPLGLKCFYQATGEPWAIDLLREWVAFGMTNFNNRAGGTKLTELFPETFCYLVEVDPQLRYVEDSLWQIRLFFRGYSSVGWTDSHVGPLSTKQLTRIYRGLVFLLSTLAKRGELPRLEKWLLDGE